MVHDLLTRRMATSKLYVSEDMLRRAEEDTFALCVHSYVSVGSSLSDCGMHSAFARIENHYFVNEVCREFLSVFRRNTNQMRQGFVRDGQLLEEQSIAKM
jgi:proline iminopeptidase